MWFRLKYLFDFTDKYKQNVVLLFTSSYTKKKTSTGLRRVFHIFFCYSDTFFGNVYFFLSNDYEMSKNIIMVLLAGLS